MTLATLSRLTSALTKLQRAKLLTTPSGGVPYVYLTEYGYFASGKFKIPESTRGKYLVQAFNLALKNRRVKQMLQFLLIASRANSSSSTRASRAAPARRAAHTRSSPRGRRRLPRAADRAAGGRSRLGGLVESGLGGRRRAGMMFCVMLVAGALATVAAAAAVAAGPRFAPPLHHDPAELRKDPLDLRAAAFGQVGTQLSLTLRTRRAWWANGPSGDSLCVTLLRGRSVGRSAFLRTERTSRSCVSALLGAVVPATAASGPCAGQRSSAAGGRFGFWSTRVRSGCARPLALVCPKSLEQGLVQPPLRGSAARCRRPARTGERLWRTALLRGCRAGRPERMCEPRVAAARDPGPVRCGADAGLSVPGAPRPPICACGAVFVRRSVRRRPAAPGIDR